MAGAKDRVARFGWVLALVLSASVAIAQNSQPPVAPTTAKEAQVAVPAGAAPTAPAPSAAGKPSGGPPQISYAGGQLRIDAPDSTLGEVLAQVAALAKVKIDIPAGAGSERLGFVKLGPGPAREILASLLSRSSVDFVILASATDPQGIQNVLLVPREKKGSPVEAARSSGSPYPRAVVSPLLSSSKSDSTPEPSSPVAAQPDNAAADTSASTPGPTPLDVPAVSQSALAQSVMSQSGLFNQSGLTTSGAMSPPASLDQQSINQQLQQMYQQRMQMNQPSNSQSPLSAAPPSTSRSSGP